MAIDDHDLDRWHMAFWENDADTLGNDYPDWMVDGYGRTVPNITFILEEQDPLGILLAINIVIMVLVVQDYSFIMV